MYDMYVKHQKTRNFEKHKLSTDPNKCKISGVFL